jgi:hypothetical protein
MSRGTRAAKWVIGAAAGVLLAAAVAWRYRVAVRDPEVVLDTQPLPVPNAFDDYAWAASLLVRPDELCEDLSDEARKALLHNSAPALAAIRAGLAHQFAALPEEAGTHKYMSAYRNLTRLLALEGKEHLRAGDIVGAVESWCDALQFSASLAAGGHILTGSFRWPVKPSPDARCGIHGTLWTHRQHGRAHDAWKAF